MSIQFEDADLLAKIQANEGKARELLEDEEKLQKFTGKLEVKYEKVMSCPCDADFPSIPGMIWFLKEYLSNEYRDVSEDGMLAILGALIYFIAPFDGIPDIIPGAGYLDDAAIIEFSKKMAQKDIEKYLVWKETQGKQS